jgi:FkbM family methyltransferase
MRDLLNYILKFFFKKKVFELTFDNKKIRALISDPIAKAWNTNTRIGYTEKTILKFIKKQKIKNVFYLGAHQGIIPIILKLFYLQSAKFICLEALRHNYLISLENKRLNNCNNEIIFKNIAISSTVGFENFSFLKLNSNKSSNSLFNRKVVSTSLIKLIEKYNKPDLVYMDVEGMEGELIKNNVNNLKKIKHVLFLELHGDDILKKYNSNNKKVFKDLVNIYNNIYIVEGDKIRLLTEKKFNIKKRIYLLCFSSNELKTR